MMAKEYDLIVVGAGPGGYTACLKARKLGMSAVCVEKEARPGGVCLNMGCIPSKALLDSSEHFYNAKNKFAEHGVICPDVKLDLKTMMARKEKVVSELTGQLSRLLTGNNVEMVQGAAKLTGPNQVAVTSDSDETKTLEAKNILLAAGSEAIEIPGLPFDGKHIVSSTEALSFDTVPDHLVVIGGGAIGLELGSVWARLGAEVTVVEMLPKIASVMDSLIIRGLERVLKKQGLAFRLNSKVTEAKVEKGKVTLRLESRGEGSTLECDKVLVAVGRKPLTAGLGLEDLGIETHARTGHIRTDSRYRTNIPSVYAIGDLIPGPALAHKASAEAAAAVENMAGKPGEVNYDALPSVIYTWPEVAAVGITEAQAKERDIPYHSGTFPFTGSGRARCMGETEGVVKILSHAKTDRVLGVHIFGPHAADLIAECTIAMEFGASAEDIARTVHAHPTFSEAVMDAAAGVRKS